MKKKKELYFILVLCSDCPIQIQHSLFKMFSAILLSYIDNYLHYTFCQHYDFLLFIVIENYLLCFMLTLRGFYSVFFDEIRNFLCTVICLNEEFFALYYLAKLRIVSSLFSGNIKNYFCTKCFTSIKICLHWTFCQYYELFVLYFRPILIKNGFHDHFCWHQ